MDNNKHIINQVNEFLVLISRLKDLKVDVSKQLQIIVLIAKLLVTWNNYRKILLHTTEDFTIYQLIKYICIKEETHIVESKYVIKLIQK